MRIRGFELLTPSEIHVCSELYSLKAKNFVASRAFLPQRGSKKSAGYDFVNPMEHTIRIAPSKKVIIWTNIKAYMQNNEVLIESLRSSDGIKFDLVLGNTLGIIDADYYNNPTNYGNIAICIKNGGKKDFFLEPKAKVGQFIFIPFLPSDNCNTEDERTGGIGSTGKVAK